MTKSIDPRYVLDEVEILGLLVERIAAHCGLRNDGESIYGVRFSDQDKARHTAALFGELKERRDTRARLAGQGSRYGVALEDRIGPFAVMEQLLDTLRRPPTLRAMRAILAAHRTEQASEEMRIESQLIHTAVANSGARSIKLGKLYRTTAGVEKPVDELTPEEFEEYLDSWAPHLPEPVRTEWRDRMQTIQSEIGAVDEQKVVEEYERYLRWVLDGYATGTAKGSMHVASYNERRPNEPSPIPLYEDTFWHRDVTVIKMTVPGAPEEPVLMDPVQSIQEAVDREILEEMVQAAPYHISITFEPKQIQQWIAEGHHISINDRQDDPEFIPTVVAEMTAGLKGRYIASIEFLDTHEVRSSVADTKLEALVLLAIGKSARGVPHAQPSRPLSAERAAYVGQIATEINKQVPIQQESAPIRGEDEQSARNLLTGDVLVQMEQLTLAELRGLRDALTVHVKYARPEKHEFVAEKHFELTPKYMIAIETTEKGIGWTARSSNRKARWFFSHQGLWLERCRMLSGLSELRDTVQAKDPADGETIRHYHMPYTMDELHTIFGPFEELT